MREVSTTVDILSRGYRERARCPRLARRGTRGAASRPPDRTKRDPLSMTDQLDTARRSDPRRSRPGARGAHIRRVRSGLSRAAPFVAGVVATFIAIAAYGTVRPGPAPLTTRDV